MPHTCLEEIAQMLIGWHSTVMLPIFTHFLFTVLRSQLCEFYNIREGCVCNDFASVPFCDQYHFVFSVC